jgi:tetratricopeptide (TPR) repeat protein
MLANLKVPNLKVMLVCAALPVLVAAGAIAVLVTPPASVVAAPQSTPVTMPDAAVSVSTAPGLTTGPAADPASGQTTTERYNEMLHTLQSGDWFSQNGQSTQARVEYQKALSIAQTLQHRQAQSVILTGLGRTYSEVKGAKDYSQAIGFYQQAIALSDPQDDWAETGRIRANLANAYRQQGQAQLALNVYQQALKDVAGDAQAEATIRQHIQVTQTSLQPPVVAQAQPAAKPAAKSAAKPAAKPAVIAVKAAEPAAKLVVSEPVTPDRVEALLDVVLDVQDS